MIKRICIYCGSNSGIEEAYKTAAAYVGKYLAQNRIGIVYGGAEAGLMGEMANAALGLNGEVTGVIPKLIFEKAGHKNLTELRLVETMQERKQLMFDLSDAFIALPGGFGTFEEIFEILTWAQLGYHNKPCAFINTNGYYNKLIEFLNHAAEQKFIRREHRDMLIFEDTIEEILVQFKNYNIPRLDKWSR